MGKTSGKLHICNICTLQSTCSILQIIRNNNAGSSSWWTVKFKQMKSSAVHYENISKKIFYLVQMRKFNMNSLSWRAMGWNGEEIQFIAEALWYSALSYLFSFSDRYQELLFWGEQDGRSLSSPTSSDQVNKLWRLICNSRTLWPRVLGSLMFLDLSNTGDRGFEFGSRYDCMSAFLYLMLIWVGKGLAMGRSPRQRSPTEMSKKIHTFRS